MEEFIALTTTKIRHHGMVTNTILLQAKTLGDP